MKKIIILLLFIGLSLSLMSQNQHAIQWYNWSDPVSFKLSPSPLITSYGILSDSLSKANNGITFYIYNDEYYRINSWADYYYWYVNAYWYRFYNPELYEYYYRVGNDFQMAKYIAGNNYTSWYYPSRIYIIFNNKNVKVNRLRRNSKFITNNTELIYRSKSYKDENKTKTIYKFRHNETKIIINNNSDRSDRHLNSRNRSKPKNLIYKNNNNVPNRNTNNNKKRRVNKPVKKK